MPKISEARSIHVSVRLAAVILLATATYILHGSALSGYWRYDDGRLLAFVAHYSPWQYFFIPRITGHQSGNLFFTPWNAFFYQINLWLFGLNPEGFYAHQLIVLWLASVATFFFLKLWVRDGWALFGALLFLSNATTVHIAQELMTGHYAAGLLFAILALYGYVLSVRRQSWRPALIGSFFYLLALLCKEIYFPLIGILLFLPEGKIRSRLRFFPPYVLLSLVYIPWRFIALNGGTGGYVPGFITNLTCSKIWQIINGFFHLPQILLGGETIAYAILLAVSTAYFYKRKNNLLLVIAGLVLTLAPLAPIWTSIGHIARFDLLFWWSLCIYFSVILATWEKPMPLRLLLAVFILALSLQTWYREMYTSDGSRAIRNYHDVTSSFILHSTAHEVLYDPLRFWYPASAVVNPLVAAEKKLYPLSPRRAFVISDPNSLNSFLLKKAIVWEYNSQCRCMEKISPGVSSLILDLRKKQVVKPLSVHVKYAQNAISWHFGPYKEGTYELVFNDSYSSTAVALPVKGTRVFDLAAKIDFYLRYNSPNGWTTRSPLFNYDPAVHPALNWSRQ